MVANNQVDVGILHISLDAQYMEKALTAFGTLWNLILRKGSYQFVGDKDRVDHTPLGGTWVYPFSFDMYLSSGSIEALVLQLSYMATIHGISPLSTEFGYIELMWPLAYFLIRGEGDADLSMLYLRMFQKVFHRRYDLRHSCLVIGS